MECETPENQTYDTPEKFKHEIENINNVPLATILEKFTTFSAYMTNLHSILGCGVPYSARDTRNTFTGSRTLRYECCFGGRSRNKGNKTNRTKKKHSCESFIEFTAVRDQKGYSIISFKNANWLHSHPLDRMFLEANGIISPKRVDKIKIMTMKGKNAKEIRKEKDLSIIPARKFYDIRRSITKLLQKGEIEDYLSNCEKYLNYFYTIHHWKKDNLTIIMKFNGSSFISRRFDSLPIALDVVFMDDTTCVNIYDFPLVTICFEDYNKTRQILAFALIPGREQHHFRSFLMDVKAHTKNAIRVFIIDRWKAQVNASIVFCRIHIFRNIRSIFGENSRLGSLFNQLIHETISEETYLDELHKMIDSAKKHKRFLQNLYNEINAYSPKSLSMLRLRKHRTTNIQEGLFGNLKQRTNNEIVSLTELFEAIKDLFVSGVMNSMSIKPETFDKEISTCKNIGHLAFQILESESKKAKSKINLIMSNSLNQQQSYSFLSDTCHCTNEQEYGLLCQHEIVNNYKQGIYPVIPSNSIPDIYIIPKIIESFERLPNSINVEDQNDDKIDFSYSNLMTKFSKLAEHAGKNKRIQEQITNLFNEIQSIHIGDEKDPMTIHEKGRRTGRPTNSGAKKKKRTIHCHHCGSTNHNIATCIAYQQYCLQQAQEKEQEKLKKKTEMQNAEEEEDIKEIDRNLIFPSNDNPEEEEEEEEEEDEELDDDFEKSDDSEKDNDELSEQKRIDKRNMQLKLLSKQQLTILSQCKNFERFLWQITEKKDHLDRPTINGIYNTQYTAIKSYVLTYITGNNELAEIETIQLIFEMNFDRPIPSDLISDILKMCREWEKGNAFNSFDNLDYDSDE